MINNCIYWSGFNAIFLDNITLMDILYITGVITLLISPKLHFFVLKHNSHKLNYIYVINEGLKGTLQINELKFSKQIILRVMSIFRYHIIVFRGGVNLATVTSD